MVASELYESGSGNRELGACGSLVAPEVVMFLLRPGWLGSAEAAALPRTVMRRERDLVLSGKGGVPLCSSGVLFRGILRGRDRAGAQLVDTFFSVVRADLAMPFRISWRGTKAEKAQTPNRALPRDPASPNKPASVAHRAQRR